MTQAPLPAFFANSPMRRANSCGRRGIAQLHARQLEAAVDEVDVIVDEAGHDEAAVQVDALRIFRRPGQHRVVRSHRHDAVSLDGDGVGEALGRIARPDLSVDQNEVREHESGANTGKPYSEVTSEARRARHCYDWLACE